MQSTQRNGDCDDPHAVTQWNPTSTPLPHEIQINLGASHRLTAFQYLPRQGGCANGWIKQYEFCVSSDGVTWPTTPNASCTFNYGDLSTTLPRWRSAIGYPDRSPACYRPTPAAGTVGDHRESRDRGS